jgi:hypothetical protein
MNRRLEFVHARHLIFFHVIMQRHHRRLHRPALRICAESSAIPESPLHFRQATATDRQMILAATFFMQRLDVLLLPAFERNLFDFLRWRLIPAIDSP